MPGTNSNKPVKLFKCGFKIFNNCKHISSITLGSIRMHPIRRLYTSAGIRLDHD